MRIKHLSLIFWFFFIFTALSQAADIAPVKLGPKDKCPVCGMFVSKYPDFMAVITYTDGAHVFFDGVKDMMKYYFNLKKYAPGKKVEDMASLHVTDYYSLTPIDGFSAFYVSGSDIYGPMGRELIPFKNKQDAEEFLKDHHGRMVYGFQDITDDAVKGLDGPP
jgi:copper chaperone NosL